MTPPDIAAIRNHLCLTQAQMAPLLATTTVYVSQLETGFRKPSAQMERLLVALRDCPGFAEWGKEKEEI